MLICYGDLSVVSVMQAARKNGIEGISIFVFKCSSNLNIGLNTLCAATFDSLLRYERTKLPHR